MALSRLAREFAAEIKQHDWSDAPYRIDRAGHQRDLDSSSPHIDQMDARETRFIKTNVMWVAAQVLAHQDPNFDVREFARECGINDLSEAWLNNGLRRNADGSYVTPGQLHL